MMTTLLIAFAFLTGMVFAAAVISLCRAAGGGYEYRSQPPKTQLEKHPEAWQWPARATGPTAESHLGKTKVSEQPRRAA